MWPPAWLMSGTRRESVRANAGAPGDVVFPTLAGVRAQGHCVVAEKLQRGLG